MSEQSVLQISSSENELISRVHTTSYLTGENTSSVSSTRLYISERRRESCSRVQQTLSHHSPLLHIPGSWLLMDQGPVLHPSLLGFAISLSWGQDLWARPKTAVAHYFSRKLIIDWEQQQNWLRVEGKRQKGGRERAAERRGLNKEGLKHVTQQAYWPDRNRNSEGPHFTHNPTGTVRLLSSFCPLSIYFLPFFFSFCI